MGLQQDEIRNCPLDDVEKQPIGQDFSVQMQGFLHLLEETDRSLHMTAEGHVVFRDRITIFWIKIRQYLAFGFQGRGIFMINEPRSSTTMRGRHLKAEIQTIGKWKRTKEFDHFNNRGDKPGKTSFRQNLKEISPENVFPLVLNLLACFFFMMNNYIIGT